MSNLTTIEHMSLALALAEPIDDTASMSVAFHIHSSQGVAPPEKIWVDGDFGLFVQQNNSSVFTVILAAREWTMLRTSQTKQNGHALMSIGGLQSKDTQQFLDALTPVVMTINALAANGWKYTLPYGKSSYGQNLEFSVHDYNQKITVRFADVPRKTYRLFSSAEKNHARYLLNSHKHIQMLLGRLDSIPLHPEDFTKKFKSGEEHIDELQSPVTTHYLALAMFPNMSSEQLEDISVQATALIAQGQATELPDAMRKAAAQMVLPAGDTQRQLQS